MRRAVRTALETAQKRRRADVREHRRPPLGAGMLTQTQQRLLPARGGEFPHRGESERRAMLVPRLRQVLWPERILGRRPRRFPLSLPLLIRIRIRRGRLRGNRRGRRPRMRSGQRTWRRRGTSIARRSDSPRCGNSPPRAGRRRCCVWVSIPAPSGGRRCSRTSARRRFCAVSRAVRTALRIRDGGRRSTG